MIENKPTCRSSYRHTYFIHIHKSPSNSTYHKYLQVESSIFWLKLFFRNGFVIRKLFYNVFYNVSLNHTCKKLIFKKIDIYQTFCNLSNHLLFIENICYLSKKLIIIYEIGFIALIVIFQLLL